MTTRQEQQKPKKKKQKTEEGSPSASGKMGTDKKKKLEELDGFIEDVLQQAGEEFLDKFKQVEGE